MEPLEIQLLKTVLRLAVLFLQLCVLLLYETLLLI